MRDAFQHSGYVDAQIHSLLIGNARGPEQLVDDPMAGQFDASIQLILDFGGVESHLLRDSLDCDLTRDPGLLVEHPDFPWQTGDAEVSEVPLGDVVMAHSYMTIAIPVVRVRRGP